MKSKRTFVVIICLVCYSSLYSQSAREILQKSAERINAIANCKIEATWISNTNSDTTVRLLKDYFQKNELDTVLGYSFVFESPNKENNFKVIYDGCQAVHISQGKYRIVNNKKKFLTSTFDLLLNSSAVISTVLSSDSVEIVQKKDTVINNIKHNVIHIYSPYHIGIFNMISNHGPLKPDLPATEIEFVINSENYLPKIVSAQLIYPQLFSHLNSITIFKANSIIEVNKLYPNFNYLDFIPKGYEAYSSDKKPKIKYKDSIWNLKTLEGDSISLLQLQGKVVLIDFFSLMCGPCLLSTPELVKLKNEFSGKNFEILGIDKLAKSNIASLKKYAKEHNINYPILVNGQEVGVAYDVEAIPTFVLMNKKGEIVYYKLGFSKEVVGEIKIEIEKLLKK